MSRATVHSSWGAVDAIAWDTLVGDQSPFLEHAWLAGLELSGSAHPATGWHPRPVLVHDEHQQLVGGAPAWQVDHSRGQYVWEERWVTACANSDVPYFPKLVLAVPFTPVIGPRILQKPGHDSWSDVLRGLGEAAKGCHSVHALFPDQRTSEQMSDRGFFRRRQHQYHWINQSYPDFDAFLARFRSARRKEIRRERREVSDLRFEVYEQPSNEIFDLLWRCYDATVARYEDSDRYLTQRFFEYLAEHFAHRVVAFVAYDDDGPVGAAMNVVKAGRMYGRYWGQLRERRFLHFELCYHQPVEYAIRRGLVAYEPGHGGEHKFRRGFEPVVTWSNHRFKDRRAQSTFDQYAARERTWMKDHMHTLVERSPFKS
ncbi:MAG: putative N-acyltransferase [Kiritimatiellia bacterium]